MILVTAPKGKGVEIARKLVEARIAACVNVGNVKSIYWWQGKIEEDDEEILVIKTRLELVDKIVEYVKRIHPYQVPEIIILPIIGGYEEYLRWVRENTRK
ncbi:MAG TPA: divalent-cation tolerance protein CutA [Pyrodictiaceae archaeon]|nr:divalent-cation tolerance protein CutA [Pyrodictiaceae archaeon]